MNSDKRTRKTFWLFISAMVMGCSMVAGPIPGVMDAIADIQPVVFVEPSSTPFLPGFYTDTSTPVIPSAVPPSATPTPTAIPTETSLPAPTQTEIILPSVTPISPVPVQPTAKPTRRIELVPSATTKKKVVAAPTATEAMIVIIPSATPMPQPTETQAPTNTLSGIETAAPPSSPTPLPTQTTAQPPTKTAVSDPANPFPGCTYYLNADFENQIFARINQAREEEDLSELSWYGPLASGARYHSIDMGCNEYFAHTGGVYENILAGYNTVEEAWNWWWNSKPHHDNILGKYYHKVGVGYAHVPGSPYRYYWTIQFSK